MSYCGNCGAMIAEGQKFCTGCGTAVVAVIEPEIAEEATLETETLLQTPSQAEPPTAPPVQNDFRQSHQFKEQPPFGHQSPASSQPLLQQQTSEQREPPNQYQQSQSQPLGQQSMSPPVEGTGNFRQQFEKVTDSVDSTTEFDPQDIKDNKIMAILAYFGILVLIPILAAPQSRFARFHANQGLILLIATAVLYGGFSFLAVIILNISWWLYLVFGLITGVLGLFFFVIAVIGIVNAARGRAKELPLIGSFKILS